MSERRVPQSQIDDANADIVGVISRHIQLKKAGKNWSACCPFHKERSPSFSVSPDKQMYYCFGCGAGGDAVSFVVAYTGCSFREAVESINGRLELSSDSAPKPKVVRAVTCSLDCHAEDRTKAAEVMSAAIHTERHAYLMRNNTASNVPCTVNGKGILIIPMINNIGETTNVAAILSSGAVSFCAGKPSYGSTAILEPEGEYDGKTIICVDYAHAWRIWWAQCGQSRVLACMDAGNFNWMLVNCKERFTHVGCDPEDADEHWEYGRDIVAVPVDPYERLDSAERCA